MLPDMLAIAGDRYEYEINVLLWAADKEIELTEIPIKTIYINGNEASHFDPIRDSYRIYSRIIKFSASSLVSFLIDFIALFVFRAIFSGLPPPKRYNMLLFAHVSLVHLQFYDEQKTCFQKSRAFGDCYFQILFACNRYIKRKLYVTIFNEYFIGMPLWIAKLITELLLFIGSYRIQKALFLT